MIEEIQEQNLTASSNLPNINIELKGEYNNIEINKEKYQSALLRLPKIIDGSEIFSYPSRRVFEEKYGQDSETLIIPELPILSREEEIVLFRSLNYYKFILKYGKNPFQENSKTNIPKWEEDENRYFQSLFYEYCHINSQKIIFKEVCEKNISEINTFIKNIEEFITSSNQGLVAKMVLDYINKKYYLKNFQNDMYQEGILSIANAAIPRFDITRGNKFSTYARWWIKQSIDRYIDNTVRAIRTPVHQLELFRKISKELNEEASKQNKYLTLDEKIAILKNKGFTNKKIASYFGYLKQEPLELDSPNDDSKDGNLLLYDVIPSDYPLPEEAYLKVEERNELIERLLSSNLTAREIAIIYVKYGLFDGEARTLDEVGKIFEFTRARADQLLKSVTKLKNITKRSPTIFKDETALRNFIIFNYWLPYTLRSSILNNDQDHIYEITESYYGLGDKSPEDPRKISKHFNMSKKELSVKIEYIQNKLNIVHIPLIIAPEDYSYLEYLEIHKDKELKTSSQ